VFKANGEMFLEIVESRWIELSSTRHRKVFIKFNAAGFWLFLFFLRYFDRLRGLVLGKELVEVLAGVASLQVRYAFWKRLLLVIVFLLGLCMFFFKEDAHRFNAVHV